MTHLGGGLSGKRDSLYKYVVRTDQVVQPDKYVQAGGLFIVGFLDAEKSAFALMRARTLSAALMITR